MTRAVLLALLAGLPAALALLDLGAAWAQRRAGAAGAAAQAATGHRLAPQAIALLTTLGRRLGVRRRGGADLGARIAAAGGPLGLTAADVVALKGAGAAVGAVLGLPLAAAAPGRLGPVVFAGAAAAGFLAPDAWLRRSGEQRARRMTRELPDVLDLLRVAVEAGLPPLRALGDVGRRHPGLLARELATAAGQAALGVPRDDALAALKRRAPLEAVAALTAAIARAERHGAPLGPALHALGAQARADAARAVTEHAARAAPKIQLAVALLLVPAVLLLVAAGAAAALLPR